MFVVAAPQSWGFPGTDRSRTSAMRHKRRTLVFRLGLAGVTLSCMEIRNSLAAVIPGQAGMTGDRRESERITGRGAVFDFLSPRDVKDTLSGREVSGSPVVVADLIFMKTSADYVLTFEILQSHAFNAVKGTIFERGQKIDRGSISQTGVTIPRIPSKITLMGTELLFDAEHS